VHVRSLDLSWITDTLAVGGRFACERTEELVREHRIRAVVDLREEDCDDAGTLARHGVEFLHLPTRDHCGVSHSMLREGVAFASRHLDVGHRLFVHCEYGIGRSALLALCILVERGHAPLDALTLAKRRRTLVSPSPEQFEAWMVWLTAHRAERTGLWELPSFAAFAAIAYQDLGSR
jgi:protein-tyrosine phosphatase